MKEPMGDTARWRHKSSVHVSEEASDGHAGTGEVGNETKQQGTKESNAHSSANEKTKQKTLQDTRQRHSSAVTHSPATTPGNDVQGHRGSTRSSVCSAASILQTSASGAAALGPEYRLSSASPALSCAIHLVSDEPARACRYNY